MKKYFSLVIIMISIIMLIGCNSGNNSYKVPKDAPEIQITIISSDSRESLTKEVPSIILLNQWNNCIYDRLSSVQAINEEYKEGREVPKGKVGNLIKIDFGEFRPETIKLRKEYRELNDNFEGSTSYNISMKNQEDSIYTFKLGKNKADAPTNQYVYTITATWGDNSSDYAFCIEVDEK
ncbi:hypothetical protein [Oceanirhabdus sp. W0125-5]|uniref:hypothetical protein n=1 Tax=Oceanirhabdus sp. W0125-5 TaxID=2999116 RepID=UPI0022F3170C|nr:hypothetical protein [Oceanirhabdus sp. W0125-5]WBW94884.1 hypothetical protein OW730_14385 [Oceanirhabdus sp. W0125-5]